MAAPERLTQHEQIPCAAPSWRSHACFAYELRPRKHMMDKKTADVRRLLIDFARLSTLQKNQFLETLNLFMYASPQRRRKIMLQWESGKMGLDID